MVDKMVRVSPWEAVGIVGSKQAPIFTYHTKNAGNQFTGVLFV